MVGCDFELVLKINGFKSQKLLCSHFVTLTQFTTNWRRTLNLTSDWFEVATSPTRDDRPIL